MLLRPWEVCTTASGTSARALTAVSTHATRCWFMFVRILRRSHTNASSVRRVSHGLKISKSTRALIQARSHMPVRWTAALRPIRIHLIVSSTRVPIRQKNLTFAKWPAAINATRIRHRYGSM